MSNWIQWRGSDRDIERRARQIRELVRLSNSLHADVGLAEILSQLADAVSTTIGFGVAAFNLVREDSDYLEVAAAAGLSPAAYQHLRESPPSLSKLLRAMRPEFCMSRSYYINHQYVYVLDGIETISVTPPPPLGTQRPVDAWHPDDMLLVPLVSSRHERLLGILSLDQPEDGKVPSLETIEIVELFANQAAITIDMATLFEERDRERQSLMTSLYKLLYQMGEVGPGSLDMPPELGGTSLTPIGDSLNAAVNRLGTVLTDVRRASEVVSQSAGEAHASATKLAHSAQDQAQHILEASSAVAGMAAGVQHISQTADVTAEVTRDAIEISKQGREAAERAVAGMASVREMTLQSARKIKRLGESTQEIGEIVQMVSDFANQTNLLALNAAIEAARAGEHGRGFTIVAQEIRNLATSSAEAAKAIHARIKAIQHDTSAVVVVIEEGTRQVVTQSDLVARAGAALEAVDTVTQRIGESIGEINQTAGQQAQAAITLARSMEDIAQITSHTRDSMEQMRSAMEHLADLAESLLQGISVFRLGPAYGGEVTGHLTPGSGAGLRLLLPEAPSDEPATVPMPAVTTSQSSRPFSGSASGVHASPGQWEQAPRGPFPGAAPTVSAQPDLAPPEAAAAPDWEPGSASGTHPQPQGLAPTSAPAGDDEIPPLPPGLEDWKR